MTRRSAANAVRSPRQLKVGEELRRVLAGVLARGEIRDPALSGASVTVTEVRVSPDLKNATAFCTPLGGLNHDAVVAALNRHAKFIRGEMGRALSLRFVPALRFAYDESFDEAGHIEDILRSPDVRRDLD